MMLTVFYRFWKNDIKDGDVDNIYFVDFDGQHELINAKSAFFLKSDELNTPMGGNIAAFTSKEAFTNTPAAT